MVRSCRGWEVTEMILQLWEELELVDPFTAFLLFYCQQERIVSDLPGMERSNRIKVKELVRKKYLHAWVADPNEKSDRPVLTFRTTESGLAAADRFHDFMEKTRRENRSV